MLDQAGHSSAMYKFVSLFVLLSSAAFLAQGACPRIISRAEWGARPTSTSALTTFPPTHVVIHHAASASCSSQSTCSAMVKAFQDQHIDVNGWADIGYNFLIGGDGNIYEGRGWGKTGAHAPNYNSRSIGICAIGEFTSSVPVDAAIAQFHNLIACGVELGQISSSYKLVGHRQVTATECPGNTFYNLITSWPRWTSTP